MNNSPIISQLLPGLKPIPNGTRQLNKMIPQKVSRRSPSFKHPYLVSAQSTQPTEKLITFCPLAKSGAANIEQNATPVEPGLIFAQIELTTQKVSLLRQKKLPHSMKGTMHVESKMKLEINSTADEPTIEASFLRFDGTIEKSSMGINHENSITVTHLPSLVNKILDEINKWLIYYTPGN